MDAQTWLVVLVLGGFLGAVGQVARAVVGLKKESDAAASKGETLAMHFSGVKLGVSLLLGFVAGILSILGLVVAGKVSAAGSVDGQTITTIIAAGYAGADFIEGFMQTWLPKSQ